MSTSYAKGCDRLANLAHPDLELNSSAKRFLQKTISNFNDRLISSFVEPCKFVNFSKGAGNSFEMINIANGAVMSTIRGSLRDHAFAAANQELLRYKMGLTNFKPKLKKQTKKQPPKGKTNKSEPKTKVPSTVKEKPLSKPVTRQLTSAATEEKVVSETKKKLIPHVVQEKFAKSVEKIYKELWPQAKVDALALDATVGLLHGFLEYVLAAAHNSERMGHEVSPQDFRHVVEHLLPGKLADFAQTEGFRTVCLYERGLLLFPSENEMRENVDDIIPVTVGEEIKSLKPVAGDVKF